MVPESLELGHPDWRTSSRCNTGNCVEVAALTSDTIGIRDNKLPASPILAFSHTEWNDFVSAIKSGSHGL